MKILVNEPILEVDGKELKTPENTTMTLADVLIKALVSAHDDDLKTSADEKLKLWMLAEKVEKSRGGSMELTIDEAAALKARVNKMFPSAIIIGNVHKIFEAASNGAPKKKSS